MNLQRDLYGYFRTAEAALFKDGHEVENVIDCRKDGTGMACIVYVDVNGFRKCIISEWVAGRCTVWQLFDGAFRQSIYSRCSTGKPEEVA